MVDPDNDKQQGFFVRWKNGIKEHQSKTSVLLGTKLLLLKFIIIGLFVGGLQLIVTTDNKIIGGVLIVFALVQLIDHKTLKQSYHEAKKTEELMEQLK
jgi:hypothetical protein